MAADFQFGALRGRRGATHRCDPGWQRKSLRPAQPRSASTPGFCNHPANRPERARRGYWRRSESMGKKGPINRGTISAQDPVQRRNLGPFGGGEQSVVRSGPDHCGVIGAQVKRRHRYWHRHAFSQRGPQCPVGCYPAANANAANQFPGRHGRLGRQHIDHCGLKACRQVGHRQVSRRQLAHLSQHRRLEAAEAKVKPPIRALHQSTREKRKQPGCQPLLPAAQTGLRDRAG